MLSVLTWKKNFAPVNGGEGYMGITLRFTDVSIYLSVGE